MSKINLAQTRTVKIGSETFITKFARYPGNDQIDVNQVGVIWENNKEKPWIVFERDNKGNIKATKRRGNQKKTHLG